MVQLDGEGNLVGRRRNNNRNGGRYGKGRHWYAEKALKEDTTGGWHCWGRGSGQDRNPKKVINSAALETIGLLGS